MPVCGALHTEMNKDKSYSELVWRGIWEEIV